MTCGLYSGTLYVTYDVSLSTVTTAQVGCTCYTWPGPEKTCFLLIDPSWAFGRLCLGMMGPIVTMEPEEFIHDGRGSLARTSLLLSGTQWVGKEHPQVS